MSPDDPRHGTEAGHEQHCRDGEKPCGACKTAKLRASRRRSKRKTMGYAYRLPIGQTNHAKIAEARRRGYALDSLATTIGISPSMVWHIATEGPGRVVAVRTWKAVRAAKLPNPLTPTGCTRRLRALTWLGYSASAIAEASRVHQDTIIDATKGTRDFMALRVMQAIANAYDELSMTPANPSTQQQRAGATRARNLARRSGYLPPLAWDDEVIDNPDSTPIIATKDNDFYMARTEIDWVVVERALAGDFAPRISPAERREIVRRWSGSHNELARLTGWKVERYVDRSGGGAGDRQHMENETEGAA